MGKPDISLTDRYDLSRTSVLLNGTQALVRLMLMQQARDRAAGLDTAGFVSGYRGSPLGAVDMQMTRARDVLDAAQVLFQPGLNEDLAATACWGTQKAGLGGEGRHDGVFALWYGKGPGVDRSGDVMRHANMAGTAPHGGVVMAMGDDHTGESSTTCHQSDWALVDASMPVISPAGVQEILDFGLYAFALSRYSGLWAGLKLMKDTVEATAVVDGRPDRMRFVRPDIALPEGGLNIRLGDHWIPQEARLVGPKRRAAEAFARANGIDRRVWGRPGARIGLVAAGKNWLDLVHALDLLGIDAAAAERMGLTTYKVGQVWPLDMQGFHAWAEGLDLIVVVEEKRKLIEVQIKEALFDDRRGRRVWGGTRGGPDAPVLFPVAMSLDPVTIAQRLGEILCDEGCATPRLRAALAEITAARQADNTPDLAARLPYFCAGCPHNTSTVVPDGARAQAGIGCHTMALWMDRGTVGLTHMGGEGANWVGEAPFSTRGHVFQNMGDGTYNHSGLLAIRFALMAGTDITYKILFNDAVAMTGGQGNDGGLSADRICRELLAMGLRDVALVHDPKEGLDLAAFPPGITIDTRDNLAMVQERLSKVKGVSAIVYVQTCAAEKRRRRKKGQYPDPDTRVFINTDVCEGCGDCGVQSNCVAIVPQETELGRKRAIDQSACNKDLSCLKGFCPSFVTVAGATPRRTAQEEVTLPEMPLPALKPLERAHNIVITGIGGTGVVTIGAVLAMAAHLDGRGVGMIEMAGLAQKGGAVHIHCRIAPQPSDINAIRVSVGECDALIGGDLVVSAGAQTLGLMRRGRSTGVVNGHETVTGAFTRDPAFRLPGSQMRLALAARLHDGLVVFDATALASRWMGDTIYSNMMVFGAAWQQGAIPLSHAAITQAIRLNGAAVAANLRAFELGRYALLCPEAADGPQDPPTASLAEVIAYRAAHLTAYQDAALAARYRALVALFDDPALQEAVARGYHKLLAAKDEYEVARLHLETRAKAAAAFGGDLRLTWHLAPPFLAGKGPDGRPRKRAFGGWVVPLFRLLAAMKGLRGTSLDPFGRSAERRMERALVAQYESDMTRIAAGVDPAVHDAALSLALLPLSIKGFGPVKQANAEKAAARRLALLDQLRNPPAMQRAAG